MMTAETSRKGPRFVLGVDGGGSKTVAVIAVRESGIEVPSEIARAETGPSNALTSDQATLNVAEAISRARKQAHQCLAAEFQIECACLSLAGTGRKGMLDVWNSWVESNNIASHVVITDDIAPILRQCSADGIALAVIAGTGSIAVGRKNDGSRVRCGGWGPMFSDEGSGYDIAKECLRVASFHEDGRADFARIHDAALEHFGATEFTEIVAKIHNATREEISRFTRKVTHGEMLQDRKVQRILDAAAHQLATMTENVARRVACDDKPIPLALAGGVLCNIPLVRRSLLANLSKRAISVKPIDVNDPVQGSVLLAADACIRRSRLAENGVLSWPFPKGWR